MFFYNNVLSCHSAASAPTLESSGSGATFKIGTSATSRRRATYTAFERCCRSLRCLLVVPQPQPEAADGIGCSGPGKMAPSGVESIRETVGRGLISPGRVASFMLTMAFDRTLAVVIDRLGQS